MKNPFIVFVSLILLANRALSQGSSTPDSIRDFVDKSFALIRTNAINRDSVDWDRIRQKVDEKTKDATTYEDLLPVYPYLFEQINDHHGALKYKGKSYYWKNSTPYNNPTVIAAEKKYKTVTARLLRNNIGYLLLPGNSDFNGKSINADAQAIRDAITSVNDKRLKGWIIDLRLNTGGSMYQMLAGIAGILGDGKLGSFVDQHRKPDGAWIIKNGNIYLDTNQISTLRSKPMVKVQAIPVVVLIGGYTASAGEVVAISFVGRANAILIGESSAGYTTANQGFQINKDAGLNLAVDYDADRKGNIYMHKILPSVVITGGDDFENLEQDTKIISAIKWLTKTSDKVK